MSGGLIYLHKPSQRLVVASVPYWNMTYGTASVLSNPHTFSEMSPWMYGLNRSGQIVPQYPPQEAAAVQAQLARLRAARMPLLPTLANVIGGRWAYQPVITSILHDPAVRASHIAAIVALVQREDYAGIDIDYEDLQASDRTAFTTFITQLAGALHVAGKMLSVDLFAKSSDRGYDQRNLAQDYQAIGRVADQVRLMGYDYHWADSGPGPVAPIGWIRAVLSYAKTQIPAGKIILGVPLYGYDWSGGHGTPVSWLQAFQPVRAVRRAAALRRGQPVTVVRLHRRRGPPPRGLVRERPEHAGQVPGGGRRRDRRRLRVDLRLGGYEHLGRGTAGLAAPRACLEPVVSRNLILAVTATVFRKKDHWVLRNLSARWLAGPLYARSPVRTVNTVIKIALF